MKVSQNAKKIGGIDLSPMLDVIFQLILFFLVSTTFSVLPAISVNLPQSTTAKGEETASITITAEADGTLWFNDAKVSMTELSDELGKYDTGKIERKEFPVSVSADREVTNGMIVEIFDAIRFNGFSAVSLRTTGKSRPGKK